MRAEPVLPEIQRAALGEPQQLDRSKPLWEMWLIEGVGEDRSGFAIFTKTHHCMVDGISGMDIASVLMDAEPVPENPLPARPGRRGPRRAALRCCAPR